jgi:hypothetical protein
MLEMYWELRIINQSSKWEVITFESVRTPCATTQIKYHNDPIQERVIS